MICNRMNMYTSTVYNILITYLYKHLTIACMHYFDKERDVDENPTFIFDFFRYIHRKIVAKLQIFEGDFSLI